MEVTSRENPFEFRPIFLIAWAIAGAIGAVGGLILGIRSNFDVTLSSIGLKCLAIVFLGGLESFGGTLIAGLVVGFAETIVGFYLEPYLPGFSEVFGYLLIVCLLFIKPYGFGGEEEIERV